MSTPSSLRTVTSALRVMNTPISLVSQLSGAGVQRERVGVHEQVRVIAVELRALVLVDGVLDGQRVQAQLLGDRRQLLAGRLAVVQPHKRVGFGDVVGDLADREVLAHQLAVAIEPRASHARTIRSAPDRLTPRTRATAARAARRRRARARRRPAVLAGANPSAARAPVRAASRSSCASDSGLSRPRSSDIAAQRRGAKIAARGARCRARSPRRPPPAANACAVAWAAPRAAPRRAGRRRSPGGPSRSR